MKIYKIKFNNKVYEIEVEELEKGSAAPSTEEAAPVKKEAPAVEMEKVIGGTEVKAPMPGNIIDIKVKEGDRVKSGQVLLILEAMKLENEIVAPSDGVVKGINTSKGSTVELGDALVVLD